MKRQKTENSEETGLTTNLLEEQSNWSRDGSLTLKFDGKQLRIIHLNRAACHFLSGLEFSPEIEGESEDSMDKRPWNLRWDLGNGSNGEERRDFSEKSGESDGEEEKVGELWDELRENLVEKFWKGAIRCVSEGKVVRKTFDTMCKSKTGRILLDVTFCRSKLDQSVIFVEIRGHFHEILMIRPQVMSLDVQEWHTELLDIENVSSQMVLWDPDEEDFFNMFITKRHREIYFKGFDAEKKWMVRDIGVKKEEMRPYAQMMEKAIGSREVHSFADSVPIQLLEEVHWIKTHFRYFDSTEKATKKQKFLEKDEFKQEDKGKYFHRFIISSEDITERKNAQDLSDIQKQLLDSTPSMLLMVSLTESGEIKYHYVNESAQNHLTQIGVKNPRNIRGKTSSQINLPNYHLEVSKNAIEELKKQNKYKVHHTFTDPIIGNHLSMTVWNAGNEQFGSLFTDVTELKNLEGDLLKSKENLEEQVKERTKELEFALATQSRFLATMSHEIRTPLSGIIASLVHISEMKNLSLDSDEMIKIGKVCSDQLLSVINDVLDFSKIEANELQLDYQPTRLQTVIEESIEVVSIQSNAKNLPIICKNINNPLGLIISIDHNRLRQIIINLLSNAAKFTNEGEIVLSVDVKNDQAKETIVEISVKDTGLGIREDFRSRIFQPFLQEDSSITRTYGGTGLGLSICKRLAKLMGGDIWVESQEGKGSTFTFTIKAEVVQEKNKDVELLKSIQSEIKKIGKKYKVGMIDHNQTRKNSAIDFFGSMELDCISFSSAKEILDLSDVSQFKVFFLVLNQMNCEAVEELLKKCQQNGIFLTLIGNQIPEAWAHEKKQNLMTLPLPYRLDQMLLLLDRLFVGNLKRTQVAEGGSVVSMRLEGVKILVAEDNEVNQKVIRMMLNKMGVQAIIVDNGKKAVEEMEKQDYDLILMDCMMPIMGGVEATRIIRSNISASRQPKIVALTADAMLEQKQLCLEAGMDDVLTKPVKLDQLYNCLSSHVRGI